MRFVQILNSPIATNKQSFSKNVPVEEWEHKTTATIGYDTARFDLIDDKHILEEFFYYGLGRIVTRYSADGNTIVWQGQIVDMTLTEPGSRFRRSIREMYNRVSVRYTALATGSNPPGETENSTTADADDATSQGQYGIKALVFRPSVEKLTAGMATQFRGTVLAQYRQPRRSADYISSESRSRLSVICEGYGRTLGWRVYNQTSSSGTANASTIVAAINTAVGEFIASTRVDTNTTAVNQYFNDDRTALEILQSIAGLGDSSNNRWVMHVMDGRKLIYEQVPTTVNYYRRLSDPKQSILDAMGRDVPLWEIRPNKWLRTTDAQPFTADSSALVDDIQSMYIESVNWVEKSNSLTLTGSTTDKSRMLVAQVAAAGQNLL